MTFFNKKPKTPIQLVEEAMNHIRIAADLLEEAVKDHPVGPSFHIGMISNLRSCLVATDDPNRGTLPLLIKVLSGERVLPRSQVASND